MAPPTGIAATSNFSFVVLDNVADFTPEVEQKVAEQLAAQLQLPASQVTLASPANISVAATLQLAAFPPGREEDVRMGIVEYLGAGDAGAQSNAKGAGCRCAGWGLVAMWAGSSQLSLTQHGFCRWQGCECLHAGTSGGACTMHAALPAHAILTHPAAAATNVTQQAAATANNRRRYAAHCCTFLLQLAGSVPPLQCIMVTCSR